MINPARRSHQPDLDVLDVLDRVLRLVPSQSPSLVMQALDQYHRRCLEIGKDVFARPDLHGCDSADT